MQKISDSTSLANASGEYTEGNPAGGQPATPIKAQWLNAIQRELVAAIALAGFQPDPSKDNQLAMTITGIVRNGTSNYALDKGAANAYKAVYSPAVDGFVDGQVLRFLAKNASTGASTFVADSLPAKPLLNTRYKPIEAGQIGIGSVCWVQYIAALDAWVLLWQTGTGVPSTLAGYGIGDSYTKTQVDALIGAQTKVVTTPSVSGSASTTAGTSVTLTASASSLLTGGSIASFTWTTPDGTSTTTTASSNSSSKAFTAQGSIGSTYVVKVMATDNAGNTSQIASKSISITNHVAPTAPTTLTAPAQVFQNSTGNQITVSGATASDGASLTYSLSQSGGVALTFSKTTGIASGEVVTFSAPSVAADTPVTISAVAVDSYGAQSAAKTASVTVSTVPSVPGTPYQGGFFVGIEQYSDGQYALIDAGKAAESALPAYTISNGGQNAAKGASASDGAANTAAMVATNNTYYEAARYCAAYRGGGFSDWFWAAKNESEQRHRKLKPDGTANDTSSGVNPDSVPTGAAYTASSPGVTPLAAFQAGGAQALTPNAVYWTSSGWLSGSLDQFWQQRADTLTQSHETQISKLIVRPMRKVKISS